MDAFRINTTVTRFLKKNFKQVIFSIKSKYLNRNLSKKNPQKYFFPLKSKQSQNQCIDTLVLERETMVNEVKLLFSVFNFCILLIIFCFQFFIFHSSIFLFFVFHLSIFIVLIFCFSFLFLILTFHIQFFAFAFPPTNFPTRLTLSPNSLLILSTLSKLFQHFLNTSLLFPSRNIVSFFLTLQMIKFLFFT